MLDDNERQLMSANIKERLFLEEFRLSHCLTTVDIKPGEYLIYRVAQQFWSRARLRFSPTAHFQFQPLEELQGELVALKDIRGHAELIPNIKESMITPLWLV